MSKLFNIYKPKIEKLQKTNKYDKVAILTEEFLIAKYEDIKIYYAPHNEYTNEKAKILIVGICPGWSQTEIAYRKVKEDLERKVKDNQILKNCKNEARFAGAMRKNIIDMLNELNLNEYIDTNSIADLFNDNDKLHTTSLIPYPVFVKEKNYTGFSPKIVESDFLMEYVKRHFYNEIKMFDNVLIIPLGKAVEEVLHYMINDNIINENQCLFGFPHPSGANGHRKQQFENNKDSLKEKINSFYSNL